MAITREVWGSLPDGRDASLYTLTNSHGMLVKISDFGGTITSIMMPDKKGNLDDIVLGFDDVKSYHCPGPYFGSIIGRHANRIQNGTFQLGHHIYMLVQNDGENHIHGGKIGFDKVLWNSQIIRESGIQYLSLSYLSLDGEEGYPGNLEINVRYFLSEDNELGISYLAIADKDTVVNLTNHTYFNLSGHSSGDILNHHVQINADKYTQVNAESLPTGDIELVSDTPMDFRKFKTVKDDIDTDYTQINHGKGYDHNWILNANGDPTKLAAQVFDPTTGRSLEVYTTKPGIQLYTGNHLKEVRGKNGAVYNKRHGLCLETQYYPNALVHKHFPSPILKAGDFYKHVTIYKFKV
jgi:aldose 1-epimerase